jgi:hypothetical protein
MAYVLYVRLIDDDGVTIATDEICAEQTIDAVPVDEDPDWMSEGSYADADGTDDIVAVDQGSMRLDDFQTVMDRLELAPMGSHGLCGRIGGRLYGFERSIGRFEIEVSPAR